MTFSVGKQASRHKGIFLAQAKIKSVEDLAHKPLEYVNKAFDLAVKVTFDIGKSFDKSVTIFGNFKRDMHGQVESIGSAFKVTRFFEELGIKGSLTPTNDIPPEWLTQVTGKQCFVLDYLVGPSAKDASKGKYYTWDFISQDPESLASEFFKSVAKGFPKNFRPDALDGAQGHEFGDAYEGPSDAPGEAVDEMVF